MLKGAHEKQVYRLSDGKRVSDYSELTDGDPAAPVTVQLYAAGFSVETYNKFAFFDAQGKKTAELDGWRSPMTPSESSLSCGKTPVVSKSALGVADTASGKILWQQPLTGYDDETVRLGCIGDYLLARSSFTSTSVDIYELSSGKRTGTVPAGLSAKILGSDGANLLIRKGDTPNQTYEAYSLGNGQRLWSVPADRDSRYLFCGQDGTPSMDLAAGGIYRSQQLDSVTRVGAKP